MKMASIKQVSTLASMCRERGLAVQPVYDEQNAGKLDNDRVNELFKLLKAKPKLVQTEIPVTKPAPVEVTQGFWKLGDAVYRVNYNQAHSHLYASRLVVAPSTKHGYRWEYSKGTMGKLAHGGTKLGAEWVKQFGDLYSHCCLCGRELTVPDSVQKGIGPVCAEKIGL